MTAKNVYVLFYRSDNGPSYMPDFCEDILGIFASFALAQDVIDNAKPSRFEHFRIEAYPLIKS